MMIWIAMGVVAVVVIGVLLWPLFKAPAVSQDRAAYDMTVFQDQLKEVERDVERGVLTPDEAEAARLEIQRRILAADKAPVATQSTDSRRKRLIAAAVVAVLVPAIAVGIYLKVGAPGLAGGPKEDAAREAAEDAQIKQMIEQLAAKVVKDPSDVDSAALLARSYAMTGQFPEAVKVYKGLVTVDPTAANFAGYGEVVVYAADGKVTKESHDAFVKALTMDRDEPRAQYYLGLEQADNKQPEKAIAIWRELAETSPKDAPWMPMVQEQMASVSKDVNMPVMTVDPAPALSFVPPEELMLARVQAAAPPAALTPRPAPAAPDQMSPETLQKVGEMVAGLATRLEANPNDYDGWLMLGRSYTVLKKYDDAKKAYDKAAGLKPGDVEPRMQYMASLMGTLDPAAEGPLPQNVTDAATDVLKVDPKQPDALYVTGLAHARTGDKAGARTYFDQAKAVMTADSPLKDYVDIQLKKLDEK